MISDFTLARFKAFAFPSSGRVLDSAPSFVPADPELKRTLTVAMKIIEKARGSSAPALVLPTEAEAEQNIVPEEAVFYLAKYFIQNREFYERITQVEISGVLEDRQVARFQAELSGAVWRHITGLLSSDGRQVKDFMPEVD